MNPLTSGAANSGSTILSSLGNNSSLITSIQNQLSTNKKTLDPAQQGVVTRLNSQVTSYAAADKNIQKAQNVLSVTATGLSSISSLLTQMQDLANKASDATMTKDDAAKLNQTFQSLLKQVTTTASKSIIDSVGLLGPGSHDLEIQTGLSSDDITKISGVNSTAADLIPKGTTAMGAAASAAAGAASNAAAVAANTTTALAAGLVSGAAGTAANLAAFKASNDTAITNNSAAAASAGAAASALATAAAAGVLDISTSGSAAAAMTALKLALDTVSTNQSSIAADQLALKTVTGTNASITQNLRNTIDTIEKPDAAQLQMDLQVANNQQSLNYYLINQMNQQASAALTIFR